MACTSPQLRPAATVDIPAGPARIVAEVEQRLSVVEELAAVVSANFDNSRDSVLQRAIRHHRSILREAFSVELAPQTDEGKTK